MQYEASEARKVTKRKGKLVCGQNNKGDKTMYIRLKYWVSPIFAG